MTVTEVISLIKNLLHSDLGFDFLAPDWTAGTKRVGSNLKIISELGWRPEIQMRKGLAQMLISEVNH
jgi:nucleoside-diphosphate-sugar epimerase